MLLAITNAIKENIPVYLSGKYIEPMNNCERYKVDSFLITDFIFTTHGMAGNGGINIYASRKTCNMIGSKSHRAPSTAQDLDQ